MTKISASIVFIALSAAAAPAAHAQSWSGAYIGASLGSAKVPSHSAALIFDTNLDGQYGDTVRTFANTDYFAPGFCRGLAQGTTPAAGCAKDDSKSGAGIRAGYDWQMDHMVYGGVLDITGLKLRDSVSGFSSAPDAYSFTRELKTLTAVRGRIGYAAGHWLVYATAGLASADIDRTFATTNALNHFSSIRNKMSGGTQIGAGGEWKVSHNWSLGLEYLATSLRDKGPTILAGPSSQTFASNPFVMSSVQGTNIRRSDDRFKIDQVSLTLTYRFGPMMMK